jgi:PRTRC genetic system protein D
MSKLVFAIDIGFGWTKAMVAGKPPFVYLSVVGPAIDVRYEGGIGTNSEGIAVKVDGRRYFVGKRALRQSPGARQTLDTAKVGDIDQKIQFYAAASELIKTTVGDVIVITGLPVADYNASKKKALRDVLEGEHVVEREGKWTRTFRVGDVHILPQGIGALYALALDHRGRINGRNRELLHGRVGIVDVGMLTTNFVLIEDLQFIEQSSNSITTGIGSVLRSVAKDLKDEYDLDWTRQLGRVDEAVRDRQVMVYGETRDVSHIVDPHLHDTAEAIVKAVQSLPGWGSGVDLKAVILTGGGSHLLGGTIGEAYPQSRVCEEPQMANVTGYLRSGIRRWG